MQSLFYDNANITVMLLFRSSCTIIILLSSVVGVWNMSKSLLWCVWDCLYEPRHDKTNKIAMCPAKTQNSLGIRPVWSESSLCAQWVAKDPSLLERTAKTLFRLGACPGWSESSLGAHSFCSFCHVAAQLCFLWHDSLHAYVFVQNSLTFLLFVVCRENFLWRVWASYEGRGTEQGWPAVWSSRSF